MKYTPNLGIPYPEPADPPRGPDQVQALAERLDAALGNGFWTTGEIRIPAGGSLIVPQAIADGAGAPQGWTLNADGTLTCKVPGTYLVGGFAYTFDTGGLNFQWAFTIHAEPGDWDPLAQYLLAPAAIPNMSGPVRCVQGDTLSARVASTSTGGIHAFASLWAMPHPLASAPSLLTPPKHAYDLERSGR